MSTALAIIIFAGLVGGLYFAASWWFDFKDKSGIGTRAWLAHYPTMADPDRWERYKAQHRKDES